MQNNASVKSLPEQKITSFSPEACLYRWVNREIVDSMFAKRTAMVKDNGKMRYPSRKERQEHDYNARQYWRYIIIESNKL